MRYQRKKINHLEYRYTPYDKDFLKKVETCVHLMVSLMQREYQFSLSDLTIILCPSVEEYIIQTGKTKESYEDWMIGCSLQEQHKIVLLSPNATKNISLEDLLKIVRHEMVHFMFDSNLPNAKQDLWISEGIAILLAEQTDLNYIDIKDFPKINQISLEENFADFGGYDYAGIYVWFFIQKYGKDAFMKVYQNSTLLKQYLYQDFEYEAICAYIKNKKEGKNSMDYRIEEMKGFQVIGFTKEFSSDHSYQEIPKFWEELYQAYGPQSSLGQAILTFKIGEFGVCIDEVEGDKFSYMIAGKYQGGVVPDGLSLFEFPKMMWAKFQCIGPLPKALQDLNTYIFGQWLPQNKEYVLAKKCSIEWYSDGEDTQSNEYVSEIWIPIKKK